MESLLPPPAAAPLDGDVAPAADTLAGAVASQRTRIHEQMDAQRRRLAAIQKELNEQISRLTQHPAAPPSADVEQALADARDERDAFRARLVEQDAELAALREMLVSLREALESLRGERESLAVENQRLSDELAQQPQAHVPPAEADSSSAELREEHENLQRRYQMALDDLKSERAHVAQLESRLAQAGSSGGPTAAGPVAGSDWDAGLARGRLR
jgi:chromosome segregation ATPase